MDASAINAIIGSQKRDRDSNEDVTSDQSGKRQCQPAILAPDEAPEVPPTVPPEAGPEPDVPSTPAHDDVDDDGSESGSDSDVDSGNCSERSLNVSSDKEPEEDEIRAMFGDRYAFKGKREICSGGHVDITESTCCRRRLNIPVYAYSPDVPDCFAKNACDAFQLDWVTLFPMLTAMTLSRMYVIHVLGIDRFVFLAITQILGIVVHCIVKKHHTSLNAAQVTYFATYTGRPYLNTATLMDNEAYFTGRVVSDIYRSGEDGTESHLHIIRRNAAYSSCLSFFFVNYTSEVSTKLFSENGNCCAMEALPEDGIAYVEMKDNAECLESGNLRKVKVHDVLRHEFPCLACTSRKTPCRDSDKVLVIYKHL